MCGPMVADNEVSEDVATVIEQTRPATIARVFVQGGIVVVAYANGTTIYTDDKGNTRVSPISADELLRIGYDELSNEGFAVLPAEPDFATLSLDEQSAYVESWLHHDRGFTAEESSEVLNLVLSAQEGLRGLLTSARHAIGESIESWGKPNEVNALLVNLLHKGYAGIPLAHGSLGAGDIPF